MSPDVVMSKRKMARRLLFAFSNYEIEKENKAYEKARR